jgi:hypothetical protein
MGTRWMAVLTSLALVAAAETVVVKREGARVMKAPRFFGEACKATVASGQKVSLLERSGGWARIAAPGDGRCWLHETAWTDRKPGELVGNPATASQRDIELAGRGFSEAEEANFRKTNPGLAPDFAIIDAYLTRSSETPPDELGRFLSAGKLGGAR